MTNTTAGQLKLVIKLNLDIFGIHDRITNQTLIYELTTRRPLAQRKIRKIFGYQAAPCHLLRVLEKQTNCRIETLYCETENCAG